MKDNAEEIDRKTLANIEKYGCQVMYIGAEDDLPPFSYSVGIQKCTGEPEVVVIGLKQAVAHFVVNEYNRRVRSGEHFVHGQRYEGFLEGYDMFALEVSPEFYEEYFGFDLWLYQGPHFKVLQLVYPSKDGVWPWQPEASAGFKAWQPLLSDGPAELPHR